MGSSALRSLGIAGFAIALVGIGIIFGLLNVAVTALSNILFQQNSSLWSAFIIGALYGVALVALLHLGIPLLIAVPACAMLVTMLSIYIEKGTIESSDWLIIGLVGVLALLVGIYAQKLPGESLSTSLNSMFAAAKSGSFAQLAQTSAETFVGRAWPVMLFYPISSGIRALAQKIIDLYVSLGKDVDDESPSNREREAEELINHGV